MVKNLKIILKKRGLYSLLQPLYRYGVLTLLYRTIYRKYRGRGYICNFCNSKYEKFIPDYPSKKDKNALEINKVIGGYGDNIYCPSCLSAARDRLIKEILSAKSNINKKTILHLAPEKHLYNFIKSKATVVTGDFQPINYKAIDPSIQFADATKLKFDNGTFDFVIANHIMEHIPDDLKAMKEIFRVLKPGGTAILQVPFSESILKTLEEPEINDPQKQSALFGQKDHIRIYQLNDYIKRLEKTGFKVKYIKYESLSDFYKFAIQPGEGFISIQK